MPRGLGKPAAFVLATLLALPACARSHPAPPLPTRATACAEGLEPLPGRVLRGFAFAHDYVDDGLHGYGSDESRESLSALRGLGSNAVSISPYGFVPSIRGSEITHANALEGGETDARVRAVIRDAHARGLAVLLKPQLWIHGGAYTGRSRPAATRPPIPSSRAIGRGSSATRGSPRRSTSRPSPSAPSSATSWPGRRARSAR